VVVRKAKDNRDVPKLYYRPEQRICPRCGTVLKRCYPVWRKYIVFLSGRHLVISMGYRCPNPICAGRRRVYASPVAKRLTLRGSSFALEVIAQIGYWRFWKRWTVAQIHEALQVERALPVSEREVLYLVGVFLVLTRCTYAKRLAEHDPYFQRHGVYVAIDALKPEKGNNALYVVRELKFGLVLHQVSLLSASQSNLAKRLLQPVAELDYRIRGVVSDDEKALRLALAHDWPAVPNQTCRVHCLRDAAAPIAEADQQLKKALKKAIRAPLYAVCRQLSQLAPADPYYPVLSSYADLIRSTLTEGSKPPFELGGLRVFSDLARLEASLQRNQKKGGIRCSSSCWRWRTAVAHSPRAIGNSSANTAGWWSWSDDWTRQRLPVNRAPRHVALRNTYGNSWRSWSSMPNASPQTPPWSTTSATSSANAGRACSPATRGLNATVPTMEWKHSLGAYAPASDRFMAASPYMNSSSAMASGPSTLTPPSRSSMSRSACSSLSKPNSIESSLASCNPNSVCNCFTVFVIDRTAVSPNSNNSGPMPFAANLNAL